MSYTVSASRCKAHYVSLGEFSKRLPKFPDSEETRAQVKPIFAENIQDIVGSFK
jgi:hypothetical protein